MLYGDDGEVPVRPDGEIDPAPVPADMGVAGWHNRKGATLRDQAAFVGAVFDTEIDRIKERRDETVGRLVRAAEWHERAVEAWHRENVATVGKTVTFPSGPRSELRASAPVLQVFDEDRLRAFLSDRADEDGVAWERRVWVQAEPKFMVSVLKDVAQIPKVAGGREPNEVAKLVTKVDGVELPGVRAVIRPDRWQRGGAK